ncbi:HesA/MoeB/ThiF family protein [Allosphingosinicella indica]|uniref:Adenylyltransferase and sulfurtransferase n=1 Tax=Allosphingosinicella indica TaxID=941907 RepID=A0A1X7FZ29_9SPHN|nr:HesA/MoeB/ThiF family protein [Allosphingosinicella indica]SMF61266.1 adenylyltransferase and sulfurtransferase [Allosphingosinicella indica]
MSFSDAQLDRYARHIVLKEIGGAGQSRLLSSHVLLIGAGGIGSPAIQYLAAAGFGRLTIVDDDVVDLANLQRQTLFDTGDIGDSKAETACAAVARLNPDVECAAVTERLQPANAARLLAGADVVIDGSDNFATRLTVSDACVAERIPLVSAALGMFQGQIGLFRGHESGQPCYRCYVGDAFDAEDCDTCSELGVLGAMAGIMGSWAAMEAIRAVTGFGPDQAGNIHIFNGTAPTMRSVRIVKDPACKGCDRA